MNKHYRQKNSSAVAVRRPVTVCLKQKTGSGTNELLYVVIKLSPLMKLK